MQAATPERILNCAQAIGEAIDQEMARDASVFVLGQGVDDFKGFYGTTKGLVERYGADRCFDTPLSEDGMSGVAIGAAMAGMRPIHTHIRMDFALLAMNQIVNIAAKARYMYGGAVHVPLVVRSHWQKLGQGAQHSQGLHSLFMHFPGLRVVCPTTPFDAKGLMIQSIRDENPVIFVEHRMVHFQKGHVPLESYTLPFGKARVLCEGKDVTIVGISHAVVDCMRARDALGQIGLAAEVIDPVSLRPLDVATIAESVKKTGRLLIVDSGWVFAGASGEIVAGVGEQLGGINFKFKRMGFADTACPTTKKLENLFYPTAQNIAAEAYALVKGEHSWQPEKIDAPEVIEFKGPF